MWTVAPDMDRKRKFICDTFKIKKHRTDIATGCSGEEIVAPSLFPVGMQDARAALTYLASLFPRKLFEDLLPPIVLKHQIYSLVQDRTAVDRQLSDMKEQGEICMFQHSFDSDVFGVVFTADYTSKVHAATEGKAGSAAVNKFLEKVLPSCHDISFSKEKMLSHYGFHDREISQLVHAGLLTVRDAGSWWLAIPGAGRLVKYLINGRKTLLGVIRKTKYKEVLLVDFQSRKAPQNVKLGLQYHIYDLVGAELVDWCPVKRLHLITPKMQLSITLTLAWRRGLPPCVKGLPRVSSFSNINVGVEEVYKSLAEQTARLTKNDIFGAMSITTTSGILLRLADT